jgi:hypothetical protein
MKHIFGETLELGRQVEGRTELEPVREEPGQT